MRFALDQLEKMNKEGKAWKGRLDLDRVGVAGHSFGAWTALAAIGEAFVTPLGKEIVVADPRIKAAVAMSAAPPRNKERYDKAFGAVKVPCLHMTGTLDDSPVSDVKAADRRVPFDRIHLADQYLIVFEGGDHMTFADSRGSHAFGKLVGDRPGMRGDRSLDAHFQELIRSTSTAFWDAYLRDDAAAKAWLTEGACKEALGKEATFEKKAGEK